MDAEALQSSLCRARELALSDAGCPALRGMLRALNPAREAVKCITGAARVPLRRASAAELLAALEGETALALRRLPGGRCAYREAELAWHAVASSAACGALDVAGAEGAAGAVAAGLVAALDGGRALALLAHPGVYLIPRALALRQQEGLVRCALRGYIEPPNRRNIDAFADPDASNIAWAAQHGQGEGGPAPPKRGAAAAIAAAGGFASGLWAAFVAGGAPPLPLEALTWSTLGCQYDWTARAYHLPQDADFAAHQHGGGAGDRWRAPFPPPLHALCAALAAQLHAAVEGGLASGALGGAPEDWGLPLSLDAQAAIVNVYKGEAKLRLPMGGHSDNMERTMRRPVVSLSLGAPAVFLVGGTTKDTAPTPVLLRSGDVLVLAGASRAAYHGVPRVFEGEAAEPALFAGAAGAAADADADAGGFGGLLGSAGPAAEEAAFARFMAGARLNINVRQVVEEALE